VRRPPALSLVGEEGRERSVALLHSPFGRTLCGLARPLLCCCCCCCCFPIGRARVGHPATIDIQSASAMLEDVRGHRAGQRLAAEGPEFAARLECGTPAIPFVGGLCERLTEARADHCCDVGGDPRKLHAHIERFWKSRAEPMRKDISGLKARILDRRHRPVRGARERPDQSVGARLQHSLGLAEDLGEPCDPLLAPAFVAVPLATHEADPARWIGHERIGAFRRKRSEYFEAIAVAEIEPHRPPLRAANTRGRRARNAIVFAGARAIVQAVNLISRRGFMRPAFRLHPKARAGPDPLLQPHEQGD
jgi:hypothetical protein